MNAIIVTIDKMILKGSKKFMLQISFYKILDDDYHQITKFVSMTLYHEMYEKSRVAHLGTTIFERNRTLGDTPCLFIAEMLVT